MKKILIGGAGGAPSEGVINSLRRSRKGEVLIGMGSEPTDLVLSQAERKFYMPYASSPLYPSKLVSLLNLEKPDLVHFQNDLEIFRASQMRADILETGAQLFMPEHDVIDTCVHKFKSYEAFRNAGVPVPRNLMINSESDLHEAFQTLSDETGLIWIRASSIGAAGKGAMSTRDHSFAKSWIDHHDGWGEFVAAELLTTDTVTWLSIWHEGDLVVAQSRARRGWIHGSRSISGVTGVTKVGMTCDDEQVTRTAIMSVKAVSTKPHGIFGVDMTYDKFGVPKSTEINISRFFTTVRFFTEAGLNMPEIYKNIALYGEIPQFQKKINPLPSGLLWLRGMDAEPRLMTQDEIDNEVIYT